jgi:predicted transcriptional regulator
VLEAKRKRLEAAGWAVGSASEFLRLDRADELYIELRLRLADGLRSRRQRKRLTQTALASALGSSQSRIAKMEIGDRTVSLDLLISGLLALGATPAELARIIRTPRRSKAA